MGNLTVLSNIFDPNNHFIPKERDTSKYPGATPEEGELLQTSQQMRSEASLYQPIVRQRLAELADPSKLRARARGRGNADAAQASARDGGTAFDRAMRRGRALTRVALQGDDAVRMQNMRDRIGMQRFGNALRTGTTRELDASAARTAESTAAVMRANQMQEAGAANMSGSIVGGLAGIFASNRRSNAGTGSYSGYQVPTENPNWSGARP